MSARLLCALLVIVACAALAQGVAIQTSGTPAAAPKLSTNQIWSAIVLATNSDNPKPTPAQLKEFGPKLKKVFGYNQLELVGSASQEVGELNESWLIPSKTVWMGLKGRRALSKEAQGGYLLSLELFQNDRSLLQSEVKLAPGSPLFIRGPQYGKGQLVVVLQVQK